MSKPVLPKWAIPFWNDSHRYKIAHGGRGSSKSWTFCLMILLIGMTKPVRILCCREIMTTLKASVKQLLVDLIIKFDWQDQWKWNSLTIWNVKTGALIMFAGLKNNPENVKSTEGIDICFIEEAQTISEDSMRLLIPTIRGKNSEIWMAINPRYATDYVYKRFIQTENDDVLSVQVNFSDNPWFPDVLKNEMKHDEEADYVMFRHIWHGELRPYGERPLFAPDALQWAGSELSGEPAIFGLDLSWSGKNALTGISTSENKHVLNIHESRESSKVPLRKMSEWLGEIPISIVVDSARPEVISLLREDGYSVRPSRKGAGSVLAGADKMAKFKTIYFGEGTEAVMDEFSRLGWDDGENIVGDRDYFDATRYGLERLNTFKVIPYGGLRRAG